MERKTALTYYGFGDRDDEVDSEEVEDDQSEEAGAGMGPCLRGGATTAAIL